MPTAEPPLASVIILGYNGIPYLEDCLRSVLDQDLPSADYEVLYVDNGSADGSAEMVRAGFPQVRLLELGRNYGYAEGNNIAYRHTRGQFVVFLNQDTVVHRAWLRELIEGLRSAPDIGAGHSNVIQPWYPEFRGLREREMVDVCYTAEVCRWGYVRYHRLPPGGQAIDTLMLHGVSLMIRRPLADELEYIFDPDFFAYAEDLDLGLRIRSLGLRTVVVPRSVVYHKHTLQTSLRPATFVRTVRIIRNRYLSFFKAMTASEFAMTLPLVTLGGPLNASEFNLSWPRRLLYGALLMPVTVVALALTLMHLVRYTGKRRRVRARAARREPWCLRAMWRRAEGCEQSIIDGS